MEDPILLSVVATADRLGMLPSQVREQATHWDFVQLAALDRCRDKEWRQAYERDQQIKESRTMSDEEKAKRLFGGF